MQCVILGKTLVSQNRRTSRVSHISVSDIYKARIKKIIYDRFDEKDISGKLSIFRYTSEECEYNENVAFEEWKELEEYKKLDSDFVTFLKKILLKFDFETFDVVTIDDLINSAFYQGLKSLVTEEKK